MVLILLFMIGLALVFNNQIRSFLMVKKTAQYEVTHLTSKEVQANEKKAASFDFDAVQPISTQAVVEAQWDKKELPVIGGVAIPSVGIHLPIFKGLGNHSLLYGAGTFSEQQQMGQGNYALASHRTDRADVLFTPLEKTAVGAKIYITDLTTIYTYTMTNKQRIQPTQVEVLDEVPGKKLITLITCGELTGQTRIVVQGELTAISPIAQADRGALDAFKLATKTF